MAIEVYRTKDKSRTFQLLKEVENLTNRQQIIITDDVSDDSLGAPAGPDVALISGAKYVTPYKGRFVLYGFPDKPNRIVISSPIQPFNNSAINFKRANLAGDLIELLMEQPVINIRAMDNFILIFCKDKAFVWQINENAVIQQNPTSITGLSNLTADSFNSSIEVSDGVLFNASEGRGVHLINRGLSWVYEGEPVKRAWTKGKLLDVCSKNDNEDVVFLKEDNTDEPEQPKVLVYNQRYKQWTSYNNRDLVSCVVWKNKLTALTSDGEIFQESEEVRGATQEFTLQTGWMNFTGAYMNFQRLRDIYLLAEFDGLTSLQMSLDYDFVEGKNSQTINFRIPTTGPVIGGQVVPVSAKKEWRFSPRQQQCSSVRIKVTAIAKSAKFDALRYGIDAGQAIKRANKVRWPKDNTKKT